LSLEFFRKNPSDIPVTRRYCAISDILHLLKRAPYRMLKNIIMVIGITTDSGDLILQQLIDLRRDHLSPIVFSNDPIIKIHDFLPMLLFRFEILLKLDEARELSGSPISFHGYLSTKLCHTMMSRCPIASAGLISHIVIS
jgi:hypothetical protein